jgi:hypothetical protein
MPSSIWPGLNPHSQMFTGISVTRDRCAVRKYSAGMSPDLAHCAPLPGTILIDRQLDGRRSGEYLSRPGQRVSASPSAAMRCAGERCASFPERSIRSVTEAISRSATALTTLSWVAKYR